MATASNHLTIPYKRTTIPPIKQAVREYLENNELDAHPDAFDWDTSQWEHLRAEVSNVNLHVSAIDDFLKYVRFDVPLTFLAQLCLDISKLTIFLHRRYHAHLVLLLTKFPVDVCSMHPATCNQTDICPDQHLDILPQRFSVWFPTHYTHKSRL